MESQVRIIPCSGQIKKRRREGHWGNEEAEQEQERESHPSGPEWKRFGLIKDFESVPTWGLNQGRSPRIATAVDRFE